MKLWQGRMMKGFLFLLIIIASLKKCSPIKKNENLSEKDEKEVVILADEKKEENKVKEGVIAQKSQKEKKDSVKELVEVVEIKELNNENVADEEKSEVLEEKEKKFTEPVIIEDIDILFEQGYEYISENTGEKQGKILASIDPITTKPKLNIIGDKTLGTDALFFYI